MDKSSKKKKKKDKDNLHQRGLARHDEALEEGDAEGEDEGEVSEDIAIGGLEIVPLQEPEDESESESPIGGYEEEEEE
eukprot:CAMPEP_0201527192 /NCGR_PEP_ID=MMETSP0161_2-20130828/34347_1 /ASSEMBLY_ACC=CAM_ASM_000251 /TAXON_ID=180227 /ORGANISM="Neoparamoeba aestuarina, Strain SoJaBio B1-5/56/2" /LENGTH=77 /DNA_ID=CAMNT_0047927909 /DNA_START=119 /DNA_END=349 /DNA_ORIENTATION=+